MSEREPDDTPEPAGEPTPPRARRPGDYYYDDATGYEIYKPEEDEDEEEGAAGGGRPPPALSKVGGSPATLEGATPRPLEPDAGRLRRAAKFFILRRARQHIMRSQLPRPSRDLQAGQRDGTRPPAPG